jgi:hypothetical protein
LPFFCLDIERYSPASFNVRYTLDVASEKPPQNQWGFSDIKMGFDEPQERLPGRCLAVVSNEEIKECSSEKTIRLIFIFGGGSRTGCHPYKNL